MTARVMTLSFNSFLRGAARMRGNLAGVFLQLPRHDILHRARKRLRLCLDLRWFGSES